jgi:hypothetical protein
MTLDQFNIKKKFFKCARCKKAFSVRPEKSKSEIYVNKNGFPLIKKEIICPKCLKSEDKETIRIQCQHCESFFRTKKSKESLIEGWNCKKCMGRNYESINE